MKYNTTIEVTVKVPFIEIDVDEFNQDEMKTEALNKWLANPNQYEVIVHNSEIESWDRSD